MSVSLQKGQKVNLSKDNTGLSCVLVGLGWDEVKKSRGFLHRQSQDIDCDAFAVLLTDGKLDGTKDIVCFSNLTHKSGAVRHMGDNLTGAGEGDDEQIMIDLKKVPQQYDRIVIAVNIYQAKQRHQHFGMIKNAFIRLVDERLGKELYIYNLSDDYDQKTCVLFGEIYRYNGEWKFNAVGQGSMDNSIKDFCSRYVP